MNISVDKLNYANLYQKAWETTPITSLVDNSNYVLQGVLSPEKNISFGHCSICAGWSSLLRVLVDVLASHNFALSYCHPLSHIHPLSILFPALLHNNLLSQLLPDWNDTLQLILHGYSSVQNCCSKCWPELVNLVNPHQSSLP